MLPPGILACCAQARCLIALVLGFFSLLGETVGPLMRRSSETAAASSLLERRAATEEALEEGRAERAESAAMSSLMMEVQSYMMMARLSSQDQLEIAEMMPKGPRHGETVLREDTAWLVKHNVKKGRQKTKAEMERKMRSHDRFTREKENIHSLLEWLSSRICARECNCTVAKPENCPNKTLPCRDECQQRVRRLHQASMLIGPKGDEYIEFPVISPLQVPTPTPPPPKKKETRALARDTRNKRQKAQARHSRHGQRQTTTLPPTTTRTPSPTETLPFIAPGSELERSMLQQLSSTNSSELRLRVSNDRTRYNGMLFAGGVSVDGNVSFTARLCTYNCRVGELYYDSTVIIGELYQKSPRDSNWSWTNPREHWIPHIDEGAFVGPEDPRMDVVNGKRFLTVTMNVDGSDIGCYTADKAFQYRHMHFIPVDPIPDAKQCRINVGEINQCMVQKNWASLVPRGSSQILYVYSVRPLQVMSFNQTSCNAQWTQRRTDTPKHSFGGSSFDPAYSVHGGTRYVFGLEVNAGDLYWSVGHTPAPDYLPVIIAVLIRKGQPMESPPKMELVGVSCPVNLSMIYGGSSRVKNAREDWYDRMLITTSVVDFNQEADLAHITFQVNDKHNYQSRVSGVGSWLKHVYEEFESSSLVFSCDMLH